MDSSPISPSQDGARADAAEGAGPAATSSRPLDDAIPDLAEHEKAVRYRDLLAAAGEALAGSLDYGATLQSVAHLAVPALADWCIIDLICEDDTLRRMGAAHVDPRKEEVTRELHRRYPPSWDSPSPAGQALRERRSVLFSELPDDVLATTVRDPEHARLVRELGIRSAMAVPLVARGRTLGVITLSTADSGRRYGEAELAIAEELARRAAIAVDNARLYQSERRSRELAERALERVSRLQAITAGLSARRSPKEVAAFVVAEAIASLGARSGAVGLLVDGGAAFEVQSVAGYAPGRQTEEALQTWGRFPVAGSSTWGDVVRTNEAAYIESPASRLARYPQLRGTQEALDLGASATLPLRIGRQIFGVLYLSFAGERAFSEEDRAFLMAVADQCAQAMERTYLDHAEREARARAEASERNLAFLAEASAILSSSLDYHSTLESVARLAVPRLADWCLVYVREDGGALRPLAVCHQDPAREHLARELVERYPLDPAKPVGLPETLRTGEPTIVSELSDEELVASARDAEHLRLLHELAPRSYLAVPLQARGRVLGAVLMVFGDSGRRYTRADLPLAQELARRAAVAVDNAGLYADEQRARSAAERAVRLRDEFISIASHELKTPITRLQLSTQLPLRLLARKGSLDPDYVRRSLSAIDDQSHKLANLVDQLLDVSRLESGKLTLDRSAVDVVAIVREVLGTAQALTDRHEISYRGPETLPAFADAVRLEQVVTNLVDNAVKYSPEGGPIEVEVEYADAETARIAVADHGVGIEPEHRPHVFDRFYQARPDDNRGGMGLGLYVSHEIVRLHGGSIALECPPTGGTRFVVTLPTGRDRTAPRTATGRAA